MIEYSIDRDQKESMLVGDPFVEKAKEEVE